MNAFLTEGLLDVFDRILVKFRPELDSALSWLRDTATPPANLVFRTDDNQQYTGLVVLERNRAILLLAVRSPTPVGNPAFQQAYRPPPNQEPPPAYQRVVHVPEDDNDDWDPRSPFYCPR